MAIWPEGVGRFTYPVLDSTSTEAVRLGATGQISPFWVFTDKQILGKGRRGRNWVDPVGNFAASLFMRPMGGPEKLALRSFIVSLALREALLAFDVPAEDLSLKRPNDVLLNGAKLAGILLESGSDAFGSYLCIGVGVNLVHRPEAANLEQGSVPPASVFENAGIHIAGEDLLDQLANSFARLEDQFNQFGFAPIRREWLNHAARVGELVHARLPNKTISGIFETVDETGAIVLNTDNGLVVLPAADIHFPSKGAGDAVSD